jgi:PLP dependent protein
MNSSAYQDILNRIQASGVQLLAVSKTKSLDEIMSLYDMGQRDFGENYVQELVEKHNALPKDIRWHFIGHLQSNKVKYIAPFVFMIQSVDSLKLLLEINRQAEKNSRKISCLLQIHIANEETKFGLSTQDIGRLITEVNQFRQTNALKNISLSGCMGMASMTDDLELVSKEFRSLKSIFEKIKSSFPGDPVHTLSMGMSSDYIQAIECGSTMVRIGSLIFGERNITK